MSWRKELTALVTSGADVKALIGNRFYAARAPLKPGTEQPSYPLALYRTISNEPSNSKGAASTLEFRVVSIEAQADTIEKAEEVFRAIRARIENYTATSGEIRRIVYQSDREDYDPDNRVAQIIADFLITINL